MERQQKSMEKPKQQRKAENSSKSIPCFLGGGERKPKIYLQGKPDGSSDRLAILAAR
jgi:hypothetical protein